MVQVRAARRPSDGAAAKTSCLALNPREPLAIVNDQVVARVLSEGNEDREAQFTECEHHGKCGAIANVFWVVHTERVQIASAGPCPKQTTRLGSTMADVPE